MDGVAHQPEHNVMCFAPQADGRGDEQLRFEVDGKLKGVSLQIGHMRKSLVAALPDTAIDLIEIAAFVYAIDSSVSRGGLMDQQMGKKWHRSFRVEMPVRMRELWSDPALKQELEEMLMFLSGDRFEFTFMQMEAMTDTRERYFDFGEEDAWHPDTVLMFSGGLDSFACALEEIIDRKHKVALISHFSATKIAPIQRDLQKHMSEKLGPQMLMHFPMKVQLRGGTNVEGTHRARSFLFAALGMATSVAFDKDQVSFYENGVVSLNLPPVGSVLGTRATRTTHPQTLQRFQSLFSRIFAKPLKVDNPFFWRTKTEVVETIARLGMADQIAFTRSCADVHNQTKQYAHCGRCSQCIDRRFAILAAGLEVYDPAEAYCVDLMMGSRERVQDKEAALSYVRSAFGYELMPESEYLSRYPELLNAVSSLGDPPDTALKRIAGLLQRHGRSVAKVMRRELATPHVGGFPENSLPGLYGAVQRAQVLTVDASGTESVQTTRVDEVFDLSFDRSRKSLIINDCIVIRGATFNLMNCLAEETLRGAGQGLELLDYPLVTASTLAKRLELQGEEAVRQNVNRSRTQLAKKFASAGFDPKDGRALIENDPWHGYRLRPDRVNVTLKSTP